MKAGESVVFLGSPFYSSASEGISIGSVAVCFVVVVVFAFAAREVPAL
jgi:hypothetical protein